MSSQHFGSSNIHYHQHPHHLESNNLHEVNNMNMHSLETPHNIYHHNGQVFGHSQDQYQQDLHNVFENSWSYPAAHHQSQFPSHQPFQSVAQMQSNLPLESKLVLDSNMVEGRSAKNLYSEETPMDTPSSTASPTYSQTPGESSRNNKKVPLPKPPKTKPRTEIVKTPDGKIKVKVKRSRMGCLTCRQRKKRCCETRPNCYECRRLSLNCMWPSPGFEHKNRPKNGRNENEGMHYDPFFGNIKILRGIVES